LSDPTWDGTSNAPSQFYKMGAILGQGAFGKVIKAQHRATGYDVAVKSYSQGVKNNPQMLRLIKTEIRALKKLDHPSCLRLIESMNLRRQLHVVTEFVSGGSLRALVRRQNKNRALQFLPEHVLRPIFLQLLQGLVHCHRADVVHRDIKVGVTHATPSCAACQTPERHCALWRQTGQHQSSSAPVTHQRIVQSQH
jgi:serine/threonine protein kinase